MRSYKLAWPFVDEIIVQGVVLRTLQIALKKEKVPTIFKLRIAEHCNNDA